MFTHDSDGEHFHSACVLSFKVCACVRACVCTKLAGKKGGDGRWGSSYSLLRFLIERIQPVGIINGPDGALGRGSSVRCYTFQPLTSCRIRGMVLVSELRGCMPTACDRRLQGTWRIPHGRRPNDEGNTLMPRRSLDDPCFFYFFE